MLRSYWFLLFGCLPGGLVLPALTQAAPSEAAEPKVIDRAEFFSKSAVDQATRKVREINRDFRVAVVIETFPSIPDSLRNQYENDKEDFFRLWARKRADDEGVKGIYVLICKDPKHVTVKPHEIIRTTTFAESESQEMAKLMARYLRIGQNDRALAEGVDFVQAKLQSHFAARGGGLPPTQRTPAPREGQGPRPAQQQPGGIGSSLAGLICFAVVALLAIWVVTAIFRAFRGGRGNGGMPGGPGGMPGGGYGPGGYGGGYGGGGFFSSLLGGMFGAAAGNWVYDSFFRSGGSSWGSSMGGTGSQQGYDSSGQGVFPADQPEAGMYSPDDNAGGDASFGDDASSGGDAGFGGEDAGGGSADFGGGGDFGGGDFGGGDFGGGGGDSSW